jgi:polyhydroxybutyrate depolymerase
MTALLIFAQFAALIVVPTAALNATSGCGSASPYTTGKTEMNVNFQTGGNRRSFNIYIPASYNRNTPLPIIMSNHGWGGTSLEDQCDSGLTAVAHTTGEFIVVHPQGMDDYTGGGRWGSWRFTKSTQAGGQTCRGNSKYCYQSNNNCQACDWTTDTDDVAFIDALFAKLEGELCIDADREYATGMSNGGMFTYELGAQLSDRLAAIVTVAGSVHYGFTPIPSSKIPVMAIVGTNDNCVPATGSGQTSDGFYYYTGVETIFNEWASVNECDGRSSTWTSNQTGVNSLSCTSKCSGNTMVTCLWNGRHQYFGGNGQQYVYNCVPENESEVYEKNGYLVWEYLQMHSK